MASAAFHSTGEHVDLSHAHLPAFDSADPVSEARALFDARAAAAVSAAAAVDGRDQNNVLGTWPPGYGPVRVWPAVEWWWVHGGPDGSTFWPRDLLEVKWYGPDAPSIYLPTRKCLPAAAYLDYFPEQGRIGNGLRTMVSAAILAASPGWCGSFGPGVDGTASLGKSEGNYDMSQMHLVAIAYQYYLELSPQARDRLVTLLLERGRIHRPNLDDTFTSGQAPNDWDRAGYISPLGLHKNIGETENHILMIATVRYLTNQLLFQRQPALDHDNRRNGGDGWSSCTSIVLTLLRNVLRGDFSEYNAKPYQTETRWALLNLSNFAYDHEVRLAAGMVLDYIAAHIAVSSNDLRRLVPFRRRNEAEQVSRDPSGWMSTGLLEGRPGADPMGSVFAMQAGNTRAFTPDWAIQTDGTGVALEVTGGYRLPYSIHDLFVNDLHRRFFQRLHRMPRSDEMGGNRNCDNTEIYASSPSYLITAGGQPSGYAIDPYFGGIIPKPSTQRQQLGVAVTTSFMPTGDGNGVVDYASDLIQFSSFAEGPSSVVEELVGTFTARNFGVAPDFACGHNLHLPAWVRGTWRGSFLFIDGPGFPGRPGFYLAVYRHEGLALLEAFDCWLHPDVSLGEFMDDVLKRNGDLRLQENVEFEYTTWNRNRLRAIIWTSPHPEQQNSEFGAEVRSVVYGDRDMVDGLGDAGNVTNRFLSGTVMNSATEAVVEITNAFLGTRITLDMADPWHPRRVSETGVTEEAGSNHEVWLDFNASGAGEGDVCRPFHTMSDAMRVVADGGTIRVVPGASSERATIGHLKRMRLVAPIGGAVIGARRGTGSPDNGTGTAGIADPVGKDDVWVEFDFPVSATGRISGPFRDLTQAAAAVPEGAVIRIVPGRTRDRASIGGSKRFRLVAPIGGVTIGWRG